MKNKTYFIGTITAPVGLSVFIDRRIMAGELDDHHNHVIKTLMPEYRKHNAYTRYEIFIDKEEHQYGDHKLRQVYTKRVSDSFNEMSMVPVAGVTRQNNEWLIHFGTPSSEALLVYNNHKFIMDAFDVIMNGKLEA